MLQNKMFYKHLQEFLKEHPDLSWQSDSSGEAIVPVRLAWHRLYDRTKNGFVRWKQEVDGQAENRLYYQANNDVPNGVMWKLEDMFREKEVVSFKRSVEGTNDHFDLYILARFGRWYVGIKTTLIET